MAADERDVPVSSDYEKSTANSAQPPLPTPRTTKILIAAAASLIILGGGSALWLRMANGATGGSNPLDARPGFETLKRHVESLAEIDRLCSKQDRLSCFCDLADRIRTDRQAIDSLLANDPELKNFQIAVRRPASITVSYDLSRLPKAPEEAECLNAVAAPTIIDEGATDSDGAAE